MACIPVYKGKRFPSTEKLIQYLSTEEGMMAHLADGKDTEFIKAIEGVVGAAEKTTPKPASLADQITDLRAKEQAEYDAMPDPNDKAKRKEIYDRYDKPISDLLAQQEKEEAAVFETKGDVFTFDKDGNVVKAQVLAKGKGTVSVLIDGKQTIRADSEVFDNKEDADKRFAETTTPSPFTAFDTKGEAGRKAREALKEEVGPEEFKRMDNIHRNGEKMLKELQAKGILEIRCP